MAATAPALITRLAPTPSGYLHLGNVLSFAITWAVARQQQGKLILRIDDLDNTRFRPEYLQDIFDTIDFMGIDYDEGPRTPAEFKEGYSQHLRLDRYNKLLAQLQQQGLLYACPCSRSQIAAVSPEGLYPLTCRNLKLPLSTPDAAWRLSINPDATERFQDVLLGNCQVKLFAEMPDFVVRRKDGIPAYQIASLADDLDMGVNFLVRGEDLMLSTAAQLYLARQLKATAFLQASFLHHPILLSHTGNKLSKSDDALSVTELRKAGLTTAQLWQKVAAALGWPHEPVTSPDEFLSYFSIQKLPRNTIAL